jgi:hypothetical protein
VVTVRDGCVNGRKRCSRMLSMVRAQGRKGILQGCKVACCKDARACSIYKTKHDVRGKRALTQHCMLSKRSKDEVKDVSVSLRCVHGCASVWAAQGA